MKDHAPAASYSKFSLGNIMTQSPITIDSDTTAEEAFKIMKRRSIHHLPVVEKLPAGAGEKIIGMVARGDLQRVISAFAGTKIETVRDRMTLRLKVKTFMTKDVVTLTPDAGIRECALLLLDRGFNSMPVVEADTGKLIGIVTSSDLMQFLYDTMGEGRKK